MHSNQRQIEPQTKGRGALSAVALDPSIKKDVTYLLSSRHSSLTSMLIYSHKQYYIVYLGHSDFQLSVYADKFQWYG